MWVEVIQCRQEGLRLRRSQWPAPVRGLLAIYERPGGANWRTMRIATLTAPRGVSHVQVDSLLPLIGPELLPAPAGKLLIRGIQIQSVLARGEDGQSLHSVFEHEQVWLCSQIAPPEFANHAVHPQQARNPPTLHG